MKPKIGTLWCRLWGHDFTTWVDDGEYDDGDVIWVEISSDTCQKCGITKEELKQRL